MTTHSAPLERGPLAAHHCVGIGQRALVTLRQSLERDTGIQAAAYLQEAGFAGGQELYEAFGSWLQEAYSLERPSEIRADRVGDILSDFFELTGWGRLTVDRLGDVALALDAEEWAESVPNGDAPYPSCHLSCGLLAEFLGRMAGETMAVMEVECRTRGDARCRFIAGAPDTLGTAYDRMAQGAGYEEALELDQR